MNSTSANIVWDRSLLDLGAFDVVLRAHRREGFDAGYRRAISDILAACIFVGEKSLKETGANGSDARKAIYRFIELLENETLRSRPTASFSGGEGI